MLVKEAFKLGGMGAGAILLAWAATQCGGSGDDGSRTGAGGGTGTGGGTATGGSSSAGTGGGTTAGTGGSTAGTGGGGVGLDAATTGTDVCPLPDTTAPDAVLYDGSRAGASCGTTTKVPRSSAWFGYDDGTSDGGIPRSVVGAFGGCGGATDCAMHATGSGFTNYGAGMGFDLNDVGGVAMPVDASVYTGGLQFWARGKIDGTRGPMYSSSPQTIHVKLLTATPDRHGDDFGFYCQIIMDGTTWTKCNSTFAAMTRDGFANATVPTAGDTFDPAQLLKIQFEFSKFTDPPDAAPTSVDFDFWIDNVSFF